MTSPSYNTFQNEKKTFNILSFSLNEHFKYTMPMSHTHTQVLVLTQFNKNFLSNEKIIKLTLKHSIVYYGKYN